MSEQAQATVVVADDEAVTRRLLSVLLERDGHVVHTAADGAEALDLVCSVRPDIVFLDAQMPSPDGYEVCARVRADSRVDPQPLIIMLTAAGQETDRKRALAAGVDEFVTKPFSPSQLRARLSERPWRQ